jgi:3-oxo-5-alpha-steroid 4-dehydrogenase 1
LLVCCHTERLLTEIIVTQWAGYAILTYNLGSLSFVVFTAANLIPRAMAHHNWYLEFFSAYPTRRRAVIPFIL